MAKCSRCNNRKAKRFCAALGTKICSLCCGQIREKEVHCPPDCPFLSKHKTYQEKRIIEKKHSPQTLTASWEEDVLKDERMVWLAFHIESPLTEYGKNKDSFNDKNALIALEYAREKIQKDKGLILMPEKQLKPQNEIGEAIYRMIETCRFEGRVILSGGTQAYTKEDKLRVLDRIILTVRQLAGKNFEGRNYINALIERFSKIKDFTQKKKILPGT
jgi:hypothetical protein